MLCLWIEFPSAGNETSAPPAESVNTGRHLFMCMCMGMDMEWYSEAEERRK